MAEIAPAEAPQYNLEQYICRTVHDYEWRQTQTGGVVGMRRNPCADCLKLASVFDDFLLGLFARPGVLSSVARAAFGAPAWGQSEKARVVLAAVAKEVRA